MLFKSACKCVLSVSQTWEMEIHASNNLLFQINARQLFRPCHCVWVLISGFQYFAIRSSGKLCVTKSVSSFNILAGCPVIIKQMWQSPVTRLAVPLFGWICDAYPCPANAIFPQLEFNHSLFKRVWRTYSQTMEGLFQSPSPCQWCHRRRMASSCFACSA